MVQVRADVPAAPAAELVLEGERSAKDGPPRCENSPPGLRWQLADGSLVPVRCGRSNSCPACAWLASVENVGVVAIDAREEQPRVGMTLTTRRADFDLARYRTAVAQLFKWLRREFGEDVAYLLLMEWTTGSGGHGRLPHGHLLIKRLPADLDLSPGCDLWRDVKRRWERSTGAWRVELRELRTAGGAIAYMVGHHHKGEQAPPEGWSGKRFRPSQNYFVRPVVDLRAEARRERLRSMALLELAEIHGDVLLELAADTIESMVDELIGDEPPELVRVQEIPTAFDDGGFPASWRLEVVGPVCAG